MRLPKTHPRYREVGGDGAQVCRGEPICNDIFNPAMGSSGQLFARNVTFDSTFPDRGRTELTRNRHGGRLGLLKPDPQLISRKLFTRKQSNPAACNAGYGLPGFFRDAGCDYKKAPFFNVLASFWIQFTATASTWRMLPKAPSPAGSRRTEKRFSNALPQPSATP